MFPSPPSASLFVAVRIQPVAVWWVSPTVTGAVQPCMCLYLSIPPLLLPLNVCVACAARATYMRLAHREEIGKQERITKQKGQERQRLEPLLAQRAARSLSRHRMRVANLTLRIHTRA